MLGSTVQCSASPMRMAYSTAWRLITGRDPGRPRHTGQMLVLGSAPNRLAQPQNSLVAVCSSQWTSSPMTSSHDETPEGLVSSERSDSAPEAPDELVVVMR